MYPIVELDHQDLSGAGYRRDRVAIGAKPISTKPANIVMPKTAGSPPVPAVATAGPI
jgi:hypothetical protein